MGWVIAGVSAVLVLDFALFLGVAASSSALDAFNQEADDREQIEAIREYNRKKAEKRANKKSHKLN